MRRRRPAPPHSDRRTNSKNARARAGALRGQPNRRREASILLEEPRELLLKPGDATAAIEKLLGAAGPGRMRFGVDVEVQLVTHLAPGGTGLILRTIGHDD